MKKKSLSSLSLDVKSAPHPGTSHICLAMAPGFRRRFEAAIWASVLAGRFSGCFPGGWGSDVDACGKTS